MSKHFLYFFTLFSHIFSGLLWTVVVDIMHHAALTYDCCVVADEEKRRKRGGEEKETLRMSEHRPLPERVIIYYQ